MNSDLLTCWLFMFYSSLHIEIFILGIEPAVWGRVGPDPQLYPQVVPAGGPADFRYTNIQAGMYVHSLHL